SCSNLEQPLLLSSPATIVAASHCLHSCQSTLSSQKLLPIAHTVTCLNGNTFQKLVIAFYVGGGASGELSGAVFIREGCSTIWSTFFPCFGKWRHSFLCK
ncbi:hypothetical protein L195_g030497, partial [Trifolium pratense]